MPRPRRSRARWLAVALWLAAPVPGRAADVTDVASSGDKQNPFDFNLRVGYESTTRTGAVKREHEGDPGQTAVNVLKDLVYKRTSDRMTLRAEIGIWHDLSFSAELPLSLSDSTTLSYDQRLGAACVFGGPGANCVNADNSLSTSNQTTFNHVDWNTARGNYGDPSYLIPFGGYDAVGSAQAGRSVGFNPGSSSVFRGADRGGSAGNLLDTINLALSYAVLSQRRDDTKPTWVLALEYRLSIGNVMAFDRAHPDANHGVADGLDHLIARTAISRRYRYLEPYALFWFDYPFVNRGDTLFFDLGANAKNSAPQMSAGTRFGLEAVPYELPARAIKVAIDASLRLSARFDGRGYSEIWEALASSPALACDPAWNPSCSAASKDPATGAPWNGVTAYQGRAFSGITVIDNFASLGGELAVVVQASRWFRLRAYLFYQRDQGHLVTIDDVGRPGSGGGRVGSPAEYNPAYRPVINEVGRRYRVDDVDTLTAGVWGQAMF